MKGHVRKRGKRWSVVVDDRDEAGRRKRRWHSGFRTKHDAELACVDILNQMAKGAYVKPSKDTVETYLTSWLDARRPQVRASTWHGYSRDARAYLTPRLGHIELQRLTPQQIDRFYADLLRTGRRQRGGGLSATTVRHIHTMLHRALSDAVRKRLLTTNPADFADPPRPARVEMHAWSAAELRTFLEHVADDRLCGLWTLLSTTGMRRGEALGLRWRDLDLDAGRASVTQTLLDVKHEIVFGAPKTAKGRRSVALDAITVATLRRHKARQGSDKMALGPTAWPTHDLVFTREDGTPVHPAWLSRAFEQRVRASDLPAIRLHDLRHTHATLALQAGVHAKVVSERLGHSTVSITLDTYSHAIPAMQEQAAERVAALVFGS